MRRTHFTFGLLSIFLCVLIVGCSNNEIRGQYSGEFVEIQREGNGYRVDEHYVADDDLVSLPGILSRFQSKKVVIGLESEVTMGQLLAISPILSESGYEVYVIDASGSPKKMSFLGGS